MWIMLDVAYMYLLIPCVNRPVVRVRNIEFLRAINSCDVHRDSQTRPSAAVSRDIRALRVICPVDWRCACVHRDRREYSLWLFQEERTQQQNKSRVRSYKQDSTVLIFIMQVWAAFFCLI